MLKGRALWASKRDARSSRLELRVKHAIAIAPCLLLFFLHLRNSGVRIFRAWFFLVKGRKKNRNEKLRIGSKQGRVLQLSGKLEANEKYELGCQVCRLESLQGARLHFGVVFFHSASCLEAAVVFCELETRSRGAHQ